MKWFTSDTHFGHTNIAGPKVSNWPSGYRDFESVHEMNKTITNNINYYVGEEDELYHLGDFSFGDPFPYLKNIICKNIHIIVGNHDRTKLLNKNRFLSVQPYLEINVGKTKFCLFHYAQRVWNKSHRGSIHLYGHSHNSIEDDWGLSMDVGVDSIYKKFGEYRPISEMEVMKYMSKKEQKFVDHHKEKE